MPRFERRFGMVGANVVDGSRGGGAGRAHRSGPAAGSQVSWRQITSGSFSSTYAKNELLSRSLRSRPRRELAFQVTNEAGSERRGAEGSSPGLSLLFASPGAGAGAKKRFILGVGVEGGACCGVGARAQHGKTAARRAPRIPRTTFSTGHYLRVGADSSDRKISRTSRRYDSLVECRRGAPRALLRPRDGAGASDGAG